MKTYAWTLKRYNILVLSDCKVKEGVYNAGFFIASSFIINKK